VGGEREASFPQFFCEFMFKADFILLDSFPVNPQNIVCYLPVFENLDIVGDIDISPVDTNRAGKLSQIVMIAHNFADGFEIQNFTYRHCSHGSP
jgi:hypothetical protein